LVLVSFGVFDVINQISMKNSFVVGVLNSCVGCFVLLVLLSGVACGAGGGFLLRWGHRRLFFELERWAPLLGS